MNQYRIRESNGYFYPEKKGIFFWKNLFHPNVRSYPSLSTAKDQIDFYLSLRNEVEKIHEYHESW